MHMEPLNIPGIVNGYKVDSLVWRGAQPDDSAWPLLAKAGCKAVIDLSSSIQAAKEQRVLVYTAGMTYISLDWSSVIPPSRIRVQGAIYSIDELIAVNGTPVFIHCQHGSDRTGTLCACWRIHHDGWTLEQAIKEAFDDLGLRGMHEFWMAAAVAEYAERTKK